MNSRWVASIALVAALAPCQASQAEEVRVYRCTGADGAIALQDTPCARDQDEQVRDYRRPPETAPSSAATAAPIITPPPAQAPPPEIAVQPVRTQPLYECLRHDGSKYESDTGIPERRWVPLWVLGLDPRAPPDPFANVGRPKPAPPLSQPRAQIPPAAPGAYAAGAWVADICVRLSPAEACERRRARLSELGRRIFNAVRQSEREQMQDEQDALRAQLRAECGIG